MNINKPTIGILATPYISQNFKHKYIFIKDNFLKLLKKNDIDSIIIPYNLSKKHLKEIIKSLDGLLIPGSQLGNFYYSKEFKDHFMTQQYLTKKSFHFHGSFFNKSKTYYPFCSLIKLSADPLRYHCI